MQGRLEAFTTTSSRACCTDLYKIIQRPLRKFHQDLHKSFSRGLVQGLDQDLHVRTPKRRAQDRYNRYKSTCRRRSYKILIQESPKSISQKSFSTRRSKRHLQDLQAMTSRGSDQNFHKISNKGHLNDLHKIFVSGPVQDHAKTL